jgi:light-regulated signal transduction histidine kinase (bacteriophytochrome)
MKIEIEELKQANAAFCHDLSNPISVVKMAAKELSNIAAKKADEKKPIEPYVRMITEASQKLTIIVQNMQVFCGQPIEGLVFTNSSFENLFQETIQALQRTFKKYDCPVPAFSAPPITVYCEPSFLKVAIYNLIKEILDRGGKNISIHFQNKGNQLEMEIESQGTLSETINKLYDPLAISKTILEKHRGHLGTEETTKNIVFKLTIPCSD